jgi:hypothetical protein
MGESAIKRGDINVDCIESQTVNYGIIHRQDNDLSGGQAVFHPL